LISEHSLQHAQQPLVRRPRFPRLRFIQPILTPSQNARPLRRSAALPERLRLPRVPSRSFFRPSSRRSRPFFREITVRPPSRSISEPRRVDLSLERLRRARGFAPRSPASIALQHQRRVLSRARASSSVRARASRRVYIARVRFGHRAFHRRVRARRRRFRRAFVRPPPPSSIAAPSVVGRSSRASRRSVVARARRRRHAPPCTRTVGTAPRPRRRRRARRA